MKNDEETLLKSGLYSANKNGDIFSHWFKRKKKLKLFKKSNGYLKFNAYSISFVHTFYLHRFVYAFFFGPIPKQMTINHKNFDKEDNRIENLELLSSKENISHAKKGGRYKNNGKHIIGVGNPKAKLSEKQVREIFKRAENESINSLAREFKMGHTAISDIKHKRKWVHLWQ